MPTSQTPSWCGCRSHTFRTVVAVVLLATAGVVRGDQAAPEVESSPRQPVVDLLMSESDVWDTVGGPGAITTFQTTKADTDRRTATDEAADATPQPPPPPAPRVRHPQPSLRHATPRYEATYAVPPADAALVRRLEEPLPEGGIRLPENATLLDLEDWLSQQAKLRVRIDLRALEDLGLDAETPLETNQVEGGGLRAALHTLLDDIDLAAIVKHGSLLLTTEEAAGESLMIGFYPLPTQAEAGDPQPLIDLIQSTVAADTWDTVGGPGAIRPAEDANTLAISQTQEVHAEILTLMRSEFDADLEVDGGHAGQIPTRIHRVRDAALATEIEAALVPLCNQALGPAGDPAAKVTRVGGDRLVVQSASRPFQIYAAEMIRAVNGIAGVRPVELPWDGGGIGGPDPGGP
jgi:hypothetical protein